VYVYYFDDIYDSEEFRQDIRNETSENTHFISIPYKTPEHIPEQELFYNRSDVWYAKTQFSINRKGYLHMCHFMTNFYGYPETEFHKYDYVLSIDDESTFEKDVPYDFFDIMEDRTELIGAIKIVDQHVKVPHQGNFDTRINLWNFIQVYLNHYNITPKSQWMRDLLEDPNSDHNFHFFPSGDSYVFKMKLFETEEWKQWMHAINTFGGIYKYRWGDNILNSLFVKIHCDYDIYDFKTVDEGYHNQAGLRHLQDYAPGVKDNSI
tara:strand:- start:5374 stop:6165 length:792 start_codon:yes stop_codon:yes gene_type:complete